MREDTAAPLALGLIAKCCRLDSLSVENALQALQSSDSPAYKKIRLKKKSGKYRIIHAPCDDLKCVQAGLLTYFYRFATSARMYGFQPKRTPLDNARQHFKIPVTFGYDPDRCYKSKQVPRWILTIDLKDAFPSVKAGLLEDMYRKMFVESKLIGYKGLSPQEAEVVYKKFIELLLALTTHRGRLPQGAPTSPYLLNLALCHMGIVGKIQELCAGRLKPFQYSIYADDITVSSLKDKISDRFIRNLIAAIEEGGVFTVNRDKTSRNSQKYKAHKITGVVLTHDRQGRPKLTLPQKTMKMWRGRIHSLRRRLEANGPAALSVANLDPVLGNIAWIKAVYYGTVMPASVRNEIDLFERALGKIKAQKTALHSAGLRALQEFLGRFFERDEDDYQRD